MGGFGWEQDSMIQAWHVTVSSSWREASQPVVVQVAAKYTVVVLSGQEVLWFVGVEGSAWYCLALHGCPGDWSTCLPQDFPGVCVFW